MVVQPYGSRTRRGAALHCRGPGSTAQVPSTSSTPRRAPQTPKMCQHTRLIRISGFPRSPKTQGPKGVQSRMCCHSFLGFGFNSKPQPHRRVGLKIPLARRVHSPVVRHTGTLSAISIPKLSFANLHPGWGSQNRMNGGDEMPADRAQRWVDFLIDFNGKSIPVCRDTQGLGQTETGLRIGTPAAYGHQPTSLT